MIDEHVERWVLGVLGAARAAGRERLTEPEALSVAEALGLRIPRHVVVSGPVEAAVADLGAFPGDRVVLKVVSADIAHKSEVGGVRVVPRRPGDIVAAVAEMQRSTVGLRVDGFGIYEFVEHEAGLGGELLAGLRMTAEFGPVLSLGLGGVATEFLQRHLRPASGVTFLTPALASRSGYVAAAVGTNPVVPLVTGAFRGRSPLVALDALCAFVARLLEFGSRFVPRHVVELEINPLGFVDGRPVALDALLTLGTGEPEPGELERPSWKIEQLLRPRSAAVIGVSERQNPGRIIVENMLAAGFPAERLYIVKPGRTSLAGCRCWPDVESLPEPVDLCVLAIDAGQLPGTLERILAARKAESLIVIPGGLGERGGTGERAGGVRALLDASRRTDWRGPVVNGGNCLGIRSHPGRYDTLFIPRHKFPAPAGGPTSPVAVIAQSGAFTLARLSKLPRLAPRYVISIGNQIDLTVGDYLTWLVGDPEVRICACYVEGFRPGDGRRFVEAAAEIVADGRTVVLYRAARTRAGAQASASHTASMAGDWALTRQLAEQAGVVVAETLSDFEDLVRLFPLLLDREVGGWRLGALSNAGFECVAMADNLGRFRLESFAAGTARKIEALFERSRIGHVVEPHNPLDVTPIFDDAAFAEAARLVLEDEHVDVGIVGCVPHTGALNTLARAPAHDEDVRRAGSVARRLGELRGGVAKAWVAVVDAGALYDPFVRLLEDHGIPVFRSADRAMRVFERFCGARLACGGRSEEVTHADLRVDDASGV